MVRLVWQCGAFAMIAAILPYIMLNLRYFGAALCFMGYAGSNN